MNKYGYGVAKPDSSDLIIEKQGATLHQSVASPLRRNGGSIC